MDAGQFGSVNDRSKSSKSLRTPFGAETAGYFSVNDRRTQSPFSDIVGRINVRAIKKNEQLLAMFEIAALQPLGIRRIETSLEQPITVAFDPSHLGCELVRR